MKKEIYIFRDSYGEYSTLFEKGFYQNAKLSKEILTQVRSLLSNRPKIKQKKHGQRDDRDPSGKRVDLADLEEEGANEESADAANFRGSNYERFFDFDGRPSSTEQNLRLGDQAEEHHLKQNAGDEIGENDKLNQLEKEFNFFLMMDQQESSEPEVETVKPNSVGRNLENIFKQEVPVQQTFDQRLDRGNLLAGGQQDMQGASIGKSSKEPAGKSSVVPPPALTEIVAPGKFTSTFS